MPVLPFRGTVVLSVSIETHFNMHGNTNIIERAEGVSNGADVEKLVLLYCKKGICLFSQLEGC
jgi:hypothetical protein